MIYDNPKYNSYDPTGPIVVAKRRYVKNMAAELRMKAKRAQEYAGHPTVLRAREDALSKVLRAKMAARSKTEQMMAKAADEERVRKTVREHALRLQSKQ